MHVMQEQINVCNATMIFEAHRWSFKSFSLIKLWVQNWVSTHSKEHITVCVEIKTNKQYEIE